MLGKKHTVMDMRDTLGGHMSWLDIAQWAWGYVNRNFPNWYVERKKNGAKQDKYQRICI